MAHDDDLTEEQERRMMAALRALGDAADAEGNWPLDQFIARHASASAVALRAAAAEIDGLERALERAHERKQMWTAFAMAAGVAVFLVRGQFWFWLAVSGVAVGVVGRWLSWRSYLATWDRISTVNRAHFDPHGVHYASKGARVFRFR